MKKRHTGEPCPHFPHRFKTEAAHEAKKQSQWRYDERKRQERGVRSFTADGYALRLRLQRLLAVMRQRCKVRPTYAGRGIKCDLTFDQLLYIWKRDKAAKMAKPSADRINNDGDYTFANVRFVELADNIRHGVQVREGIRQARRPAQPTREIA